MLDRLAPKAASHDAAADTQPFAVAPPQISLPKGGGAIHGIGEKFAANPVTGTGSMSVPIATSPGRSGFAPDLSLSYDSGGGNGPFGFGWSLSIATITRKTDKGLPIYGDAVESDVYILSRAEDMVKALRPDGSPFEDSTTDPNYIIHRYRPRVEGLFARIERWTEIATGQIHWRSITRDNVTTRYGKDDNSRIFDPASSAPGSQRRIFSWLICDSYDDKGNAIDYEYAAENDDNVNRRQAHERNRERTANRYLKRIRYGNRVSRLVQPDLASASWMFEVVFDYEEGHYEDVPLSGGIPEDEQHRFAQASPAAGEPWAVRPDPFSSHRSGFEVRTYRRCSRVLMFHHIPDLPSGEKGYDGLVRSTEFDYADLDYASAVTVADELAHQGSTRFASFMLAITQSGYVRDDTQPVVVRNGVPYATYLKKSLPRLEFEYSKATIQDQVLELDGASVENLPSGLDGSNYQWVDLHGEGIPGILTEQSGGAWFYKRNLSPINAPSAAFAPVESVRVKPNLSLVGGAQFMDLAGDGLPDLVVLEGAMPGLYEHDDEEGWEPFRPFTSRLNRDARDPNLKLVDLDGDGHADVLISEDDAFVWHASQGEAGFGPGRRVAQARDEEQGPRLLFADGTQSIYLADMCGDGLTDLVRIRNGEVSYWPNLGYGRFGAKVSLDNVPWFDNAGQFDQSRIRLADIDGSGTNDIIYLHREGVRLYFNQSGNRLSDPRRLAACPPVDSIATVMMADLLGNGTACLVWSSPLPSDARRRLRYIDLMGGKKPHLLLKSVNNLGAETQIEYAHSTRFYLEDKRDGRPWVTRLPFPVHVVERVLTRDRVSGNQFVTRYAYHHGCFDGIEREFRGFGMVEQWDTEEFAGLHVAGQAPSGTNIDASSHVPPVHTKTWFHTGVYLGRAHVSDFFAGLLDAADVGEYYREPGMNDAQARANLLDDTVLPPALTVDEEREACRALKGSMLRQEIYALDQSGNEEQPYAVTEQNFSVRMLQPRAGDHHGVFFTHLRESISYHYERSIFPVIGGNVVDAITAAADPTVKWLPDPRVAHTLNLEVDKFGSVSKSARIGYARRYPDLRLPSQQDRDSQAAAFVTYTENAFTKDHATGNDIIDAADDYRTPMHCESRTYEVTGLTLPAGEIRFTFDAVLDAGVMASALDYEKDATAGSLQKRLIEHIRTYYRRNTLAGPLPLGELESLALPFESYKLALTPGLLAKVYGGRATDAMIGSEGRYVHSEADAQWWIPSGQIFYSPNPAHTAPMEQAHAFQHFFLPHRYRDPFHTGAVSTESTVTYDTYDLMVQETRDPVGNRVTAGERAINPDLPLVRRAHDYRVLQPMQLMDPNRNQSEVRYDALGMIAGTAVRSKPYDVPIVGDQLTAAFRANLTQSEIDKFLAHPKGPLAAALLDEASTRLVYDLTAYSREPDPTKPPPTVTATLARETHASEAVPPGGLRIQVSLAYSDGFGREIQKKIQAEPGPVPARDPAGKIVVGTDGQPQLTSSDASPRWVGSGWTVFNNKGKPVRQYEPFFTDSQRFEFEVRIGVSPVLFYDPMGRVVATLHPDHTWEKVAFHPWRQESSDVNDNVSVADPRTDGDVGDFFRRLASTEEFLPTWHALRTDPANAAAAAQRWPDPKLRDAEQRAAEKTAVHAATPTAAHMDCLGRTFLTVAHNKFKYSDSPAAALPLEEFHCARVVFDIEGNQRAVLDAKNRVVMRYDYDLLGNRVHQASMEAGARWMLNDVGGKPLYAWDSRGHRFRSAYDALRRPTDAFLQEGAAAESLIGRSVYGETRLNPEANNLRGRVVQVFDHAGILSSDDYDFKGNLLRSQRQLAQAYSTTIVWSIAVPLDAAMYAGATRYDALNRPVQVVAPHSDQPGATVNVVQPVYNEANLLEEVHAWLNASAEPGSLLATATADLHAVTNIDYDAKGQRTLIEYGNGVRTTYTHDPLTFRLAKLLTQRTPDDLQSLNYTYDPAGNVTHIRDDAQQTVYFRNKRVEPSADYTYDATYRLIEATGREHLGQVGGAPIPHSYNDAPRVGLLHPGEGNAMGTYLERYVYDLAGNFESMKHVGSDPANPGWTREYVCAEPSLLEGGKLSNRLTRSFTDPTAPETYSVGGDGYDAHGNMLRMPQLQELQWDFKDQLRMTRRQKVNASDADGLQHQGERTWYVYDGSGRRVRKVTERATGAIKDERVYLGGGFELFRSFGSNALVRETLHIMDDKQRIALVETRTAGVEAGVPQQLIRFQLGNHLGSASLELDDQARIISYEEHTPYGSTSYQGVRSQTETPKRYRYTGKVRDEESGLYYHGARYYAPWVGSWINPDPSGLKEGPNLFRYVQNNPITFHDPTGLEKDKGFLSGLGGRFWQRATAPSDTAKALQEGRIGDFAKHLAIDAVLAANPAIAMAIGDIQLASATIDLPGQVKDAATLPRGDEGGAKMADALITSLELVNRILGPKAEGILRKSGSVSTGTNATPGAQKAPASSQPIPADPAPAPKGATPPTKAATPATPASPAGAATPAAAEVVTAVSAAERPPLLVQVEIKPVAGESGGWRQLKEPTRSSYGAVGIITEGGGYEGVATYDRVTGRVELKVSPIGEGGGAAKTYQIGQLTASELADLQAKSGGDPAKFGNLAEAPIRRLISNATGQPVLDPGKNPSKTGVDWRPQQPPLPFVH
jgi:RHS repeat-associated protein